MSRWPGPARVLGRDEFGYWVIHDGVAVLCSPNCMHFSSRTEINERRRHGASPVRPQGQRGFSDLRREQYREPVVLEQARVPDVPLDNDVSVPENGMNQPDRSSHDDTTNVETHQTRVDMTMTTDDSPVHEGHPAHEAASQPGDVPVPNDHEDDDEWLPGSTNAPASWDMLIGGAGRGRDEAVQAFSFVEIKVLPEEGYNIDPSDLRRCIFLHHNPGLLENVQRTDVGWPLPMGRVLEEALDIIVEFTYRVPPERQDVPFAHPAATPPDAAADTPETTQTTSVTTRRPREDADDHGERPSPRDGQPHSDARC